MAQWNAGNTFEDIHRVQMMYLSIQGPQSQGKYNYWQKVACKPFYFMGFFPHASFVYHRDQRFSQIYFFSFLSYQTKLLL